MTQWDKPVLSPLLWTMGTEESLIKQSLSGMNYILLNKRKHGKHRGQDKKYRWIHQFNKKWQHRRASTLEPPRLHSYLVAGLHSSTEGVVERVSRSHKTRPRWDWSFPWKSMWYMTMFTTYRCHLLVRGRGFFILPPDAMNFKYWYCTSG